MKRIMIALMLAASLLLLPLLSSCEYIPEKILDMIGLDKGEPETADELYERILEQTGKQSAYETELEMSMLIYVSGVKVVMNAEGKSVVAVDVGGDEYYYTKIHESVKTANQEFPDTFNMLYAYYEGQAFMKNIGEGVEQAFYSTMTADEYKECYFNSRTVGITDTDFLDCRDKAFERLEDGGWKLVFSGYTARSIRSYSDKLGLDSFDLDHDIEDLNVTITVDENYLPTEIEMNTVFEENELGLELNFRSAYFNYNSVTLITNELDSSSYKLVENFFILDDINDMLRNRAEDKNGEFNLSIKSNVTMMGQNVSSSNENDNVKYGEGDYGFYYNIDSSINGQNYKVSYKNGTLTSLGQTSIQSVDEARRTISALINTAGYNKNMVEGISWSSDEGYIIGLDVSNSSTYRQIADNAGIHFEKAKLIAYYTIVDGEITNIRSEVVITGYYYQSNRGYPVTIEINSEVDFVDVIESSENAI